MTSSYPPSRRFVSEVLYRGLLWYEATCSTTTRKWLKSTDSAAHSQNSNSILEQYYQRGNALSLWYTTSSRMCEKFSGILQRKPFSYCVAVFVFLNYVKMRQCSSCNILQEREFNSKLVSSPSIEVSTVTSVANIFSSFAVKSCYHASMSMTIIVSACTWELVNCLIDFRKIWYCAVLRFAST